MSVHRRGTGDAVSPNRQQYSDISEPLRIYFDVPANSENFILPDYVASDGTDFVQNEIPWWTNPGAVTEDGLFDMDLTETMFETPSSNLPICDAFSSFVFVQNESSGQESTEGVVPIEVPVTPSDYDETIESFRTNLSSVCSGLDYPSTSKAGSSTDPDAGGAPGFHNVPLQKELVPFGIRNDQIKISLLNKELWQLHHQHDNEMLVRYTGCYLSPPLHFTISGLEKTKLYSIFLEFPTRDDYFWIYNNETWNKAATNEEQKTVPFVQHPMSPSTGHNWMACGEGISFNDVKLCWRADPDSPNFVTLNIFQAYVPQISVMEVDEYNERIMETLVTVTFPETAFIAVASYQNPQVRKLKYKRKPKVKSPKT